MLSCKMLGIGTSIDANSCLTSSTRSFEFGTVSSAISSKCSKTRLLAYTPLTVTHYFVHYYITCIFTSLE